MLLGTSRPALRIIRTSTTAVQTTAKLGLVMLRMQPLLRHEFHAEPDVDTGIVFITMVAGTSIRIVLPTQQCIYLVFGRRYGTFNSLEEESSTAR